MASKASNNTVQLTRESLLAKLKPIQTDFIVGQNGISEAEKRIETIRQNMLLSSGKFQALSEMGVELGLFTDEDIQKGIPNVVAEYEVEDTSEPR